jgi:hypothetical protein
LKIKRYYLFIKINLLFIKNNKYVYYMIYYMILVFIVIVFIHKYINIKTTNNLNEKMNNINNEQDKNKIQEKNKINIIKKDYATEYDLNNTNFVLDACPLKDTNNFANSEYINKFLTETQQNCYKDKPVKTIDNFHNDFFSFRDMTHQNSSMIMDPVDNINMMIVNKQDNSNKKIKDIYDDLTKNPIKSEVDYDKIQNFNNINHDDWTIHTGSPGLFNTIDGIDQLDNIYLKV